MKKISLTVIGLYLFFLHSFAQVSEHYNTSFKSKKLKLEEVNIVTSYYTQDGNHSAVTGGIGTENVTDFANIFELKLVGYGETGIKHTILAGLGIDHHTAASQKYVSQTGASKADGNRVYPSLNWTVENEAKGTEFGIGTYYSHEYNYTSYALDAHVGFKNKTGGEFSLKGSAYLDQVKLIYPSELIPTTTATIGNTQSYDENIIKTNASRGSNYGNGTNEESGGYNIPSSPRNTYTGSFTYSQIINKEAQFAILLDLVKQDGYLGLPFHRVFFENYSEKVENLPTTRTKIPIGARVNYFLGDNLIVKSYYRFYTDDWGLTAHTASVELPYKFTPFFSVAPFYRYYTQTATKYFAPYAKHAVTDTYYTSNYASSAFSSNFMGANVRIAPPNGFDGSFLSAIEIRFGHYTQTTDLNSNVISFHFTLK
jgi:hypothetical protein